MTELIKMHMFGIMHPFKQPGQGETTAQIYANYRPVPLSLEGTRVRHEDCFGLCTVALLNKAKRVRVGGY